MIQLAPIYQLTKAMIIFLFWFIGLTIVLISLNVLINDTNLVRYISTWAYPWDAWPVIVALIGAVLLSAKAFGAFPAREEKKKTAVPDTVRRWVIPTGEDTIFNGQHTHGTACFLDDSQKELMTSKTTGLWIGGGFVHHGKYNLITIAPPQEGKGSGQIIPNLLMPFDTIKRSYVVNDPKGVIAYTTIQHQKNNNQKIVLIDPYRIQDKMGATHGIKAASVNFLDLLYSIDTNIVSATTRMVRVMLPDPVKEQDNDFTAQARELLQSVILHILTSDFYKDDRSLVTVWRLISASDWDSLLCEMLDNLTLGGLVQNAARKFAMLKIQSERTWGSTIYSLGRAIDWLKDPEVRQSLLHSDYNPFELAEGVMTVYLCLPFDKLEDLSVFTRLFFDFSIRANSKHSRKPKEFVYYILDEFPAMGRFDSIRTAMSQYPEFNMRFWLHCQTLGQLDRIYGREGRMEFLALCNIKTFFGINDIETAQYVSDSLGSRTVEYKTQSHSKGESSGDSYSDTTGSNPTRTSGVTQGASTTETKTENLMEQKLLRPDQVMCEEKMIVMIKGLGNMRLKRWLYYQKPKNIHEQYWYDLLRQNLVSDNPNVTGNPLSDLLLPPAC